MRGAATCFGFSQPSAGSYYMCFAKVIIINNQLKYVVIDAHVLQQLPDDGCEKPKHVAAPVM